jgi:putative hydrolase of the HAD superfamily
MTIQAVLFDADGVLQRPAALRREAWQHLLGADQDVDEFVAAVFDGERQALAGGADFIAAFSDLLVRWRCQGDISKALHVWTMIEPDVEVVQVVQALRKGGTRCCLATNQEPYRASFMSQELGYYRLFDREFYSCHMGVAKPASAYFNTMVRELGVPPADILFLDDREDNVMAAREAGLNAAQFLVDSGSQNLVLTLRDFGIGVA